MTSKVKWKTEIFCAADRPKSLDKHKNKVIAQVSVY